MSANESEDLPVPATAAVEVIVSATSTLCFAMEQSGIPFIRGIEVRNLGVEPIAGATLDLDLAPGLGEPKSVRIGGVPVGESTSVGIVDYRLPAGRLREVVEAERARLQWTLRSSAGKALGRGELEVEVLAFNEWPGARAPLGLLATFVLPNHPVVARILARVRDRLAGAGTDLALCGYQSRSPTRVRATVAALYEVMQSLGVTYVGAPASFEKTGQKIRLPDIVLRDQLGNCLDVTVLFAACFEQLGLHPIVIVVQEHAFPAVWLMDERFPEGVVEDAARLRKLIALGEILAFDSSTAIARPPVSLERACARADEILQSEDQFLFALDIRVMRDDRFRPLPLRLAQPEGGALKPEVVTAPVDDVGRILAEAEAEPAPAEEARAPTEPAVVDRFRRWQDRLLDLSLRNKLLNFNLRSKGSLALDIPDIAGFEDLLAADRALDVMARAITDPMNLRDATLARARTDEAALRASRLLDLENGIIHTPLGEAELWSHAKRLVGTARIDLEEGGACTLYAAIGILRWYESVDADVERIAPLLLYPIDLEFDRKKRRIRVRRLPEDPILNITLIEKMRRDYAVDFSPLLAVEPDESGLDVPWLLRTARAAIQRMPRWDIREEAHLGLFTFTKFLMWKDLNDNAAILMRNEVVRHISASRDQAFPPQAAETPPDRLDAEVEPADLPLVVDADASQMAAVVSAVRGRSFVLQGPPGTGKSQTITNLIAAALSGGKTVLFVSEKMAALEVVHRRLVDAGLGDFCLELHSHKSNKKQVLESFAVALNRAERQGAVPWEERSRELRELCLRLNAYPEALHAIRSIGLSFYAATARILELRDAPELRVRADGIEKVSEVQLRALRDAIASFAPRAAAVEPVSAHPFVACELRGWSAKTEEALGDALDAVDAALDRFERASTKLATVAGIALPPATDALVELVKLAAAIGGGPVPIEAVDGATWADTAARAASYAKRRRAADDVRADLGTRWTEAALSGGADLEADSARVERWALSSAVVAALMLFGARRRLRRLARGDLGAHAALAADLQRVRALRRESATLDDERAWVERALPGFVVEPEAIESAVARGAQVRAALGRLRTFGTVDIGGLLRACDASVAVERRTSIADASKRVAVALGDLAAKERALLSVAAAKDGAAWPNRDAAEHREGLRARVRIWREAMPKLRQWCFYRQEAEAVQSRGLAVLVDAHRAGTVPGAALPAAFERWFLTRWTTAVRDQDPALRDFEGAARHRLVERFRASDNEHRTLARRQVTARLEDRLPNVGAAVSESSEIGILRRELKKKVRHLAIRKLIQALPHLHPRLKPCLLMSPLSVAQYIPADGHPFDLVVFDEASQIGTHDAIGAIARGRQVVIVGDSRQLPPTTFFSRAFDDDEEEAGADENDVVELESILDEAIAKQLPEQMLGWHYRSRHESLIDFSNRHYYGGRLDIFPAARTHVEDLGVEWRHVADGVYVSGSRCADLRTNRREAVALVDYLVSAMRRWKPEERTFGVVTFNMPQQELIQELLEERRAADPSIDAHFGGSEGVFVKNLEKVQGDERDEILFSITYARDQNGRLRIAFGPLSTSGGERRLNVAVTRARRKLVVFSTLRPEDIDLSRTRARGTADLRAFLEYVAKHGQADDVPNTVHAPRFASRFESELHDCIRDLGYAIRTQVGCGGYRVDLAVVHPARSGEYLLGVECDGPAYRSAKTARDRDRLRLQVLESLGWTMHRVWSTDWWFDRNAETKRLKAALEAARTESERPKPAPAASAPAIGTATSRERTPPAPPAAPGARAVINAASAPAPSPVLPYIATSLSLVTEDPEALHALTSRVAIRERIAMVVAAEAPIHEDLLARRIVECWNVTKLTARARGRVFEEVRTLEAAGKLRVDGTFIWPSDADPAKHQRFRGTAADGSARDAEHVPPEEIAAAAAWVLQQSLSIERVDLVRETARLLGYQRVGKQVAQAMEDGVALLVARGTCAIAESRAHWRGSESESTDQRGGS